MTVTVSTRTDVGLRRDHNEDALAVWSPDGSGNGEAGVVVVVADGMGGARAGEVASRLAVETVLRACREAALPIDLDTLAHSIEAANQVIHEQGAAQPDLKGMGTTCTAVLLRDAVAWVAHVGDSRVYLVREGAARQVTRDHSLVAQLVESHHLTPEQARVDPRRNLVTRSVGVSATVAVDAQRLEESLRPGDTVVVCTDGLHGLMEDGELAALASGPDLEDACTRLIALANARGGPDNITVVLARLAADPPA